MELFDSHCHLNDEKFNGDREEIIKNIFESGITKLVNAGYSIESSKDAIELSKKYDFIYATVGISPNDIEDIAEGYPQNTDKLWIALRKIEELANEIKVVAIGEIGLDYYWNKDNKELQKRVFIEQIKLANKLNKPIVIHTREAVMDTIDILKNQISPLRKGVFHCCPFNRELVKEALKLGFYISFAGPVTFKNSKNAKEIVDMVPIDRILIETDSPYLSPEPLRGRRNDSRNVKYMAEKIAEFKGISVEELARITYENARMIFEI